MIPARDGVKLHTIVYAPKNASGKLPFLLFRTPYGISKTGAGQIREGYKEFVRDGYIFVLQDIRGRYGSEGTFVMLRLPRDRRDRNAIDEGTDTNDTVDWLLKNVANNNGRAGVTGVSYGGWLTAMAMLDPHPAIKAVSEQASPADMYLGDDFHHNGAFRLSYGFEYVAMMETGKENYHFQFDRHDTYEWYLGLGPLANVNAKYLRGQRPTWNDFVEHPNYDAFWQKQAVGPYLTDSRVPNLNVAGWWDQEDFYGPVKIYETLEKHDSRRLNYLVAGPWNHGGWRGAEGRRLGILDFGSDTSREFREKFEAPWFAWWLKDKGTGKFAEAQTFRTGANTWQSYDSWPPRQATTRNLYFRESGRLAFETPAGEAAFDSYISDPANPVPYRHRPMNPTYGGPGWTTWLTEDQRFVHRRPDVLSWESDPLDRDLNVAGDIVARLFASTTGTDCDWIVKLIDVYPEDDARQEMRGYQLIVADEVLRARFRKSFEHPEPLRPSEITEYAIDLHTNDHAFQKGHRVMVQVQSTWFPLIDRNPQKYVPNIFKAVQSDFEKATQRVFRSKSHASRVELPVVN